MIHGLKPYPAYKDFAGNLARVGAAAPSHLPLMNPWNN